VSQEGSVRNLANDYTFESLEFGNDFFAVI
jgi:hypothetical protein